MSYINPSLEAIRFQTNNPLGPLIEALFSKIIEEKLTGKALERRVQRSNLDAIIKKMTGLNIEFTLFNSLNAFVYPPTFDRNSVLMTTMERLGTRSDYSNKIFNKRDQINGRVDLVKAQVSGDFSEQSILVGIGLPLLSKGTRLNAREVTGILLHELGHAFVMLELLGQTHATNQVLAMATEQLLNIEDEERQYQIVEEIEYATGFKLDGEKVLQTKTKVGMTLLVIDASWKYSVSAIGSNIYNERAFEQLADQFANRMGYGKDIVTGLDKVSRFYGNIVYSGPFMRFTLRLLEAMSVFTNTITMLLSFSPYDYTYDEIIRRFEVIRADSVKALRDKGLSKVYKEKILSDIRAIDNVTSKMKEHVSIAKWLWENVIPAGRKEMASVRIEQAVERLITGNTRVPAAELELLI